MLQGFYYRRQVRFLLAILSNLHCGRLTLTLPDGSQHQFSGAMSGPDSDLTIHTESALRRLLHDGKMGFCEAFMDGEASSQSLPTLIELAVLHDKYLEDALKTNIFRQAGLRLFHMLRRNNKLGSAKNIAHHYDIGNSFYEAWLDPTMTYSSAVFDSETDDLTTAQLNKYKRLAELADIQPGDRVLEIGCGWGGFAKFVSKHIGAHVTGITISQAQLVYAKASLAEAGLQNKVDLKLMDYRDLQGRFDKIVSIEMFEAVGQAYWPVYFDTISRMLKSGGRAVIQSITIDHDAFQSYRDQPDFIQRYIFPGGMLPSMPMLQSPVAQAGLELVAENGYASDYARTLQEWRARFLAAWPSLAGDKFDNRFKRMWELYLAYCEGGFRAGMIDVKQILLMHKSN
ncbi:MAG: cyclopropane-fatty-acyl-phospholipid synthase family protein [Alphaproteobacteria bacterium]|jgi:cyclopropane-fatty-acyl-phospholipid synthase|nr:cyclopropane-fatty-acyl-phospholipid synthase family protein [Alphaproteobacteria bacterium]